MIISISGKIGSGKDTIGKIIQAYMEFPNASELSILRILEGGIDNSSTKIKKWADKLKEMLCVMTGTTREQWEDSTFKATVLDEQWWYWGMELDGGYGKVMLNYLTTSQAELSMYEGLTLIKPTYRNLLELLGTECGRNIIHPNIWVNSLMSEYRPAIIKNLHVPGDYVGRCLTCDEPFLGAKRSCTCKNCESITEKYPNWIITDTRFPNELQAVKSKGGITIKVLRGKVKCSCITRDIMQCDIDCNDSLETLHESETALDDAKFDYTIDNNDTIEELVKKIKEILIIEKII